ncbi:14343_t:CDS:2 [Acaulospora colombiana]|uniref:14343_t:CDS:1 n=1 Tax=Acaulospora colombiana TaxID=27376 RepID=A0ACA9JVE9_9GLOM|nr:14343_t:CDS:2 [Acaulospora colombiana]
MCPQSCVRDYCEVIQESSALQNRQITIALQNSGEYENSGTIGVAGFQILAFWAKGSILKHRAQIGNASQH